MFINKAIFPFLRFIGRMDWIRYGVRSRIIRAFCDPDSFPAYPFEVRFFGNRYRGNLNSYLDWIVYFFGAYEKQELLFLRSIVAEIDSPVFIDIGANVGEVSLFMASACKHVHAFEPWERVRLLAEDKIELNAIKNVTFHSVGLSNTDGELEFFAPHGCNTGTGSFVRTHAPSNNAPRGKLHVVNGDDYLARLGLKKINLIKIDVEGFEKNVLSGLANTLAKYRPVVFMEFSSSTKQSFSGVAELQAMLPPGYKIKTVLSNKPVLTIFNSPSCSLADFSFENPGENIILLP